MVISRETDYSMRILRCLADGKQRGISEICDSVHIPRQFGNQIVRKLQSADFVICTKGKEGGIRLCTDLHKLTLYDVMNVIGDECCINLCLSPGHVCPWRDTHMDTCKIHPNLAAMQDEMAERLKNMDLYSVMFGAMTGE